MKNAVFDIEADNLLHAVTKVHCLVIICCETGDLYSFDGDAIPDGLALLDTAETIYAHNGVFYDIPTLHKIYGWVPKAIVRDTMLWAQFLFSDLKNYDARVYGDDSEYEIAFGSHSLENWGLRLGCPKSEYTGGWDVYTPEMLSYCKQDVRVCERLRQHLQSQNRTKEFAIAGEHQFAAIMQRQEQRGVRFDTDKAIKLADKLQAEMDLIEAEIVKDIPPTVTEMKTPQHYVVVWPDSTTETFLTKGMADAERKRRGIKPKDCSITPGPMRQSVTQFNIGSRDQVRTLLYDKHKWVSSSLTDGGEKLLGTCDPLELAKNYGKLSEEVLRDCPFPIGQRLADYYLTQKISSFLRGKDEQSGWLNLVKDGRIHGRIMTIGCSTMRCSHSRPNTANIPHVNLDKEKRPLLGIAGRYGVECRELFMATEGYQMVGGDLSAIELVCLAERLYFLDGGAYANVVLNGDVHQVNADAIGKYASYSISRKNVKGVGFAWAYGAGDRKLGSLAIAFSEQAMQEFQERRMMYLNHPSRIKCKVWSSATKTRRNATPDEAALTDVGGKIRLSLENGVEGLKELLDRLKEASKKGYLNVLGRQVPLRSSHSALNTLLQSTAAIVMKKWVCLTDEYCKRDSIEWHPLLCVHDELDSECRPEFTEAYKANCLAAMGDAGKALGFRVPVTGNVLVGSNWFEVH